MAWNMIKTADDVRHISVGQRILLTHAGRILAGDVREIVRWTGVKMGLPRIVTVEVYVGGSHRPTMLVDLVQRVDDDVVTWRTAKQDPSDAYVCRQVLAR